MADLNLTSFSPSAFILNGIPGMEAAHIWISIPFSVFYIICPFTNLTVLVVVGKEQILHEPMYMLLCMLALTDIGLSTCVVPRALGIFWFGFKDITLDGCLFQIFFFYVVTGVHSTVLMIMAFDRYVAISDPLRYTTILTNARTFKLAQLGLTQSFLFVLAAVLLIRRLLFCINHIIQHTYCEHMAIVKLSCGDIIINERYTLVSVLLVSGLDLALICLSYGLIIRAVIRISSKKACHKALSTCMAHICVIMMSYTSSVFTSLTHRFGQSVSVHIHIIFANLYVVIPPMLTPIIYGVKTKELCDKLERYICQM